MSVEWCRLAPLTHTLRWLLVPVLGCGLVAFAPPPASAQSQGLVKRDNTLGSGRLEVVPGGTDPLGHPATYLITSDMGERHGDNLFHSFERFGIGADETATFTGPDGIDNVISRVTGPSRSEIDGTLRSTIPGADVWLLNPHGVMFGAGAQLDVPGSFHASTGDYVGFGDGDLVRFYADPSRSSVLSTATPMAFGFLGASPTGSLSLDHATLAVADAETLELVAGDVSLTSATLDASGATPGSVAIRAGRLAMTEGSKVLAETESTVPDLGPGLISIDASESVLVDDSLLSVSTHGAGNAGTIHVESPEVTFQNGPGLPLYPQSPPFETQVGAAAETFGSGAGGTIEIDTGALTLENGVIVGTGSGAGATGNAGTVKITGGRVDVSDRSFISVGAYGGTGNAGTILIDLTDGLQLDAARSESSDLWPYAFLYANAGTTGATARAPGRIEIQAGAVEVKNGAYISASCSFCTSKRSDSDRPEGAGTINIIDAGSIDLSNRGSINAGTNGEGDAGTINIIDAGSIDLSNRGSINAGTNGEGDAGTINIIDAGSLDVSGGAILVAGAQGRLASDSVETGNGGRIKIEADEISISGVMGDQASGIFVSTERAWGNAGTIEIETHMLDLARGALIDAETLDPTRTGRRGGNAGTIAIVADSIRLHEKAPVPASLNLSGQPSITVGSLTSGNAGTLHIETRTLDIDGAGLLLALNRGTGNPGSIDLEASEAILVDGGGTPPAKLVEILQGLKPAPAGIYALDVLLRRSDRAGRTDDTPSIHLAAPDITLTNGAIVSSATIGGADAGNVLITGNSIHILNGATVDSTTMINPLPLLSGGSVLQGGKAGLVTLEAKELIEVAGRHPNSPDDVSSVTSASLSEGDAGAVTLRAPRIQIVGGAVATTVVAPFCETTLCRPNRVARGGDITLDARKPSGNGQVVVRGGGRVDASTYTKGEAGRIDVVASESIAVEGGSRIESRTGAIGKGGDVALRAPRIALNGGRVSAESAPTQETVGEMFSGIVDSLVQPPPSDPKDVTGDAGSITLEASRLVHLDAGEITTSVGVAHGGTISIDPEFVILEHGSRIASEAIKGAGGHIQITADNFFAFPGSVVSVRADNPELSGTLELHAPDVNLAGQATPLPASFLDASSLMRERCAARTNGERAGSFAVRGSGGIPPEPDGWLRASVALDGVPEAAPESVLADPTGAPLLALRTCQASSAQLQ